MTSNQWPYKGWKPSGWDPEGEKVDLDLEECIPHPHGGRYIAGCEDCKAAGRARMRRLRTGV